MYNPLVQQEVAVRLCRGNRYAVAFVHVVAIVMRSGSSVHGNCSRRLMRTFCCKEEA